MPSLERKQKRILPALADEIAAYQKSIGNDDLATERSLSLLREEGCIIAGQQVGLLGGPSFTLAKVLSTLLLAKKEGGAPLFWAATEDHDTAEVASATFLSEEGNLRSFRLPLPEGYAVESLPLDAPSRTTIRKLIQEVGLPLEEWEPLLQESTRYAEFNLRVMVKLFRGSGLLFVEPWLFRPFSRFFFAGQIERVDEIAGILGKTKGPLTFRPNRTTLFYQTKRGKRVPISWEGSRFFVGERVSSQQELLQEVEGSPERFSTGAAARTLLQTLLLPTLACVVGQAEGAYWNQLQPYFTLWREEMPPLVERLHLTLLPPEMAQWAEEWKLPSFPDLSLLQGEGGPDKHALHIMRNLLYPRNRPQERVLNGWWFERRMGPNLFPDLFSQISPGNGDEWVAYGKSKSDATWS